MKKESVLIRLRGISKSFDGETVLDNIDLDIHDKEFITCRSVGLRKDYNAKNYRRF